MNYIKLTFLVGLFLALTGCASSGRPAVPNTPGAYDHIPHFSTIDAFKELLVSHKPSERELKAKEALGVHLQQFDNYGFIHSDSPTPSQDGYDAYINEKGKPTFRFSYAYFSEKHDGIILVSLWDDNKNKASHSVGIVKSVKDEYELVIPDNSFCSATFNASELGSELAGVMQSLSSERQLKLSEIQKRKSSTGAWAFHPGAFRLGTDAGVDSVVNIVSSAHMRYAEYYYLHKLEAAQRSYVPSWDEIMGFESVSGCLLKTSRLKFLNELTSS